jgi:hypothetical protein
MARVLLTRERNLIAVETCLPVVAYYGFAIPACSYIFMRLLFCTSSRKREITMIVLNSAEIIGSIIIKGKNF